MPAEPGNPGDLENGGIGSSGIVRLAAGATGWRNYVEGLIDTIEKTPHVTNLEVRSAENPSTTRNIAVAPGRFIDSTGAVQSYAGTSAVLLSATNTHYVYLTDAGVLTTNTTGFPTTAPILRLAVVTTGATTIASVQDMRIGFRTCEGPATSGASQAAVTLGNVDGAIGGLAIGAAYSQAEMQALRNACETLADDVRALSTLVHALRSAGIATRMMKGGV